MLHQSSGNWRLGLGLSLLTVFMWGILPVGLAIILQVLDVYTLVWFRFQVSFAILGIYLSWRRELPTVENLRNTPLKLIATASIFLALNYLFFSQGLEQTSPSNAEVLIQIAPVLMGLGALVIFRERYTLSQWVGMGILTLGFSLFFHEQLKALITSPSKYIFGSGLVVLGAIVWAIYALAQKQLLQCLPSSNTMLLIYGICTLIFIPFATFKAIFALSLFHLAVLLFCALNTVIAYGAFAESLEHWEASRVSAVLALAPVVTLISVWILSLIAPTAIAPERITLLGLVGAIFVVVGSIVIALGRKN